MSKKRSWIGQLVPAPAEVQAHANSRRAKLRGKFLAELYEIDDAGCWNWTGTFTKGFPVFQGWSNPRVPLYEKAYGARENLKFIGQLCGNRRCVCPQHQITQEEMTKEIEALDPSVMSVLDALCTLGKLLIPEGGRFDQAITLVRVGYARVVEEHTAYQVIVATERGKFIHEWRRKRREGQARSKTKRPRPGSSDT